MEREVMTSKEVCKYLSVTRQTLYRWIVEFKLPVARLGRTPRFKRSAINEWLDSRTEAGER